MACNNCGKTTWQCERCDTTLPHQGFTERPMTQVHAYCSCCQHRFLCALCYRRNNATLPMIEHSGEGHRVYDRVAQNFINSVRARGAVGAPYGSNINSNK